MVDTLIPFDTFNTFKREINRSLCDLQMQNIRRRKKRERERKSVFVYVCVCVCVICRLSYFHIFTPETREKVLKMCETRWTLVIVLWKPV